MRAIVVVDTAPAVEGALTLDEVTEAAPVEQLGLERAMKPLALPWVADGTADRGSPRISQAVNVVYG